MGRMIAFLILGVMLTLFGTKPTAQQHKHARLDSLFSDWREFAVPRLVDGVPDYGPPAMSAQYAALAGWRTRHAAIDTTGWSVHARNDHAVIGAEMAGLDFDHRVRRPWALDPAFYR